MEVRTSHPPAIADLKPEKTETVRAPRRGPGTGLSVSAFQVFSVERGRVGGRRLSGSTGPSETETETGNGRRITGMFLHGLTSQARPEGDVSYRPTGESASRGLLDAPHHARVVGGSDVRPTDRPTDTHPRESSTTAAPRQSARCTGLHGGTPTRGTAVGSAARCTPLHMHGHTTHGSTPHTEECTPHHRAHGTHGALHEEHCSESGAAERVATGHRGHGAPVSRVHEPEPESTAAEPRGYCRLHAEGAATAAPRLYTSPSVEASITHPGGRARPTSAAPRAASPDDLRGHRRPLGATVPRETTRYPPRSERRPQGRFTWKPDGRKRLDVRYAEEAP